MKWGGSLARLPLCAVYGRPVAPLFRVIGTRCYSSSSTPSLMQRLMQPWQTKLHAWVEKTKPVASSRLSELSHKWNDYSGYAEIHALKEEVQVNSNRLTELQEAKEHAKRVYIDAVAERSLLQRKVNDLLSRKPTWNDNDLLEYTKLLHSEHSFAKAEEGSQHAYEQAEREMQRGFDDLMRSVMRRYHEEHLWSDRVRSVSTYVSVGLGVLNVLIFFLALFLVEPYKRRKLAQTLEKRLVAGEEEARDRVRATVHSVDARLAHLERLLSGQEAPAAATAPSLPLWRLPSWLAAWASYLHAWGTYSHHLWQQVNPFPAQGGHVAATAGGLVLGSLFSYWLALVVFL
ncbi:sensitivity to high expression protein she9 [Malassezia caprae]|uniref:Sensitive to high expression protein 9, mitochondrial n=1 Tax=Malassezia caprae TaxID=1381934 RepID=A0AAF0EAX2_9BASI|nr:sensitivity to high expression protein she9 [Malassezia caprae]